MAVGSGKSVESVLRRLRSPLAMSFYFLWKLPSCRFWRIRVMSIDRQKAVIRLPFRWRTQNPFQSIYFAAQLGAAELSTGLLSVAMLADKPRISMLITGVQANFTKKAKETVYFSCDQGAELEVLLEEIATGKQESGTIDLVSTGRTAGGIQVCEAVFSWSFKKK